MSLDPQQSGRFLLGIECDGAAYHSARTARDRDRLRADVLRSLGWRLHRIWSTDWWTQPERVLDALERAIADATAAGPLPAPAGANAALPARSEATEEGSPSTEASGGITPPPLPVQELGEEYVPCELARSPAHFELDAAAAQSLLAADVQSILAVEAPIYVRLIATRLSVRWGITRVTQRVTRTIENVIQGRKLGVLRGEVAWRHDQEPATYVTVRRPGEHPDSERKVEDIPPEELLAAARQLLQQNLSIREEDFQRAIGRAFGFRRSGSKVAERAQEAIDQLVARGEAKREGEFVGVGS